MDGKRGAVGESGEGGIEVHGCGNPRALAGASEAREAASARGMPSH
jgi:hypothetical protein